MFSIVRSLENLKSAKLQNFPIVLSSTGKVRKLNQDKLVNKLAFRNSETVDKFNSRETLFNLYQQSF